MEGRPVAGMVTLVHKASITYKYGGSDMRFNNAGGMALLFWNMMLEAKAEGMEVLDLGRCDADNEGLITYKDRLGSTRSMLTYWRSPRVKLRPTTPDWKFRVVKRIFGYMPDPIRVGVGKVLYPHVG
jgi:hypothetical protein